jgi:DNA polymerase-3 subunit alpha
MAAPFVHLHVHSAYSLAEGAIQIKSLVKKCRSYDMPAVAVTDTNNLFGAMEFAMEASKEGIQPIIGSQVIVDEEEHQLVLLVQSDEGYKNLSAVMSSAYMHSGDAGRPILKLEDLARHSAGLICLTGGVKGAIGQFLLTRRAAEAENYLLELKKIFGDRLYVEIQRHLGVREEDETEEAMIELAYKHNIPLVATNDCYFPSEDFYQAHDALLCIAEGRYVNETDRRKVTKEHYFKDAEEMVELFADLPEAVANTLVIAQRCHFYLENRKPILPPFKSESGLNEVEELRRQSRDGLEWRLENFVYKAGMSPAEKEEAAKPYRERLEFELKTIIDMGFPGYFLIVSDFIIWAKSHNIPVGPGRGSGAGSVVAWSLKITDLDPLSLNLLFERFLNPERVSMPDFDVDFCQDRRDEVIRYVQERYGYDKVAQIITFGKLQARAVVRDVGRVLQIPYYQVDRISKMIPNNPANPVTLAQALEGDPELQAQRADDTIDRLLSVALQLEGLYRHASTHAAGVVIGDRPLHEIVPLYRDPRSEMPVTQFNMKYVEPASLVKFDFLGLKTLTVIQKAVELIADKGEKIDILQIPLDDQKSYEMISSGMSVGVFQLESSGMRDTLRKMKPNRFEDIIALVALYRPGPMDNIPKYISVKEGKEEPDYLHPKLKPILEETYGIMVYQEQVMQAAQLLSGYTLGGADLLRRAMGKKIKAEMDAQREAFVKGAGEANGVDPEYAGTIFDTIEKFAGYGFNKSHAAAYALVAYQTAWLKANHPVEFMAASMTLDMGNTDKLAIFKQALDRMDIPVLPPDINKSNVEFAVEGHAVRYALAAIKGVGAQAMAVLTAEREKKGPFKSLEDFLKRIDSKTLNKKQMENLIAAGALDSIHPNRAQLHNSAEKLAHYAQALAEERSSNQSSLFAMDASAAKDLAVHHLSDIPEWNPLDRLSYEFGAIGFYLSAHPLDTKRAQLERLNIVPFMEVEAGLQYRPVMRVRMAGVLIRKAEKISAKNGNKFAFLTLSDSSGVYEVMLFSETLMRTRSFLEPGQSLLLMADAELRDDQLRLTVQDVRPLEEALENQTREVTIQVSKPEAAPLLKSRFDEAGDGAVRVTIAVDLSDGRHVKISIPQQVAFTADTRNKVFQTPGVVGLQEL